MRLPLTKKSNTMKVFRSMVFKGAAAETHVTAIGAKRIALGAEGFDPHVGLDCQQAALAGAELRGRIDQRFDVVVSIAPCQRETTGFDRECAAATDHDSCRIPQLWRR